MEEKMNGFITCKSKEKQDLQEIQCIKSENQVIELDKGESEAVYPKPSANIETKSLNDEEVVKSNSNKVLKRKVTEDGVTIERVLSEGEASSGFETISAVDSKLDINDLDLSFSIDEDDYNIIVNVENELAVQNRNRSSGRIRCQGTRNEKKRKSSGQQNHKSYSYQNEYPNQRNSNFRTPRKLKYWQRNNVDKNYNYGRRDKKSSERKNFDHSRHHSCNNDQSTYRDHVTRSKRSRWMDTDNRSRRSRSNEHTGKSRGSRSPGINTRNKSPSYKDTKAESRYSRSFDRSSAESSPERSSPPRKRTQKSCIKGSSSFVWRRLDNRTSNTNDQKKNEKNSFDNPSRKKERTPFLVEVEKKLKQAGCFKNFKKDSNGFTYSKNVSENETTSMPAVNQNCKPPLPSPYVPKVEKTAYPAQYIPMPSISVHKLPLVPGPTGLPVYITATGETIPHDMDGRPIPVGPNGYYLPLDPTGRIFPHIISPENQAVPIHMTEDGILRLPNSEPVPFGPGHQLPVNIDGRVIFIGPDSRPLYPCLNLPKEPPSDLLRTVDSSRGGHVAQKMSHPPTAQTGDFETSKTGTRKTETESQISVHSSSRDISLLDFIQNPSKESNKAKLPKNYNDRTREKSEDAVKCSEIEKNLGVSPSKGGIKRSIPMKLMQKKITKDDTANSGSDIILDSGDSDSASAYKSVLKHKRDPLEEVLIKLYNEQDVFEIICDKQVPTAQNVATQPADFMIESIQRAIKLLGEEKYTPPKLGRFIIPDLNLVPSFYNSPNESPLLRKRIQLSFITPGICLNDQPITNKKSSSNFKLLLPETMSSLREEKHCDKHKSLNVTTSPVFAFDFAMQCDFTSEIIKNLSCKVRKLELEIAQLKQFNANLFGNYKKAQTTKEKKSEELRRALLIIQDKNNEIRLLKHSAVIPK